MDRRTRWIAGLIVVAAGIVSWPALAGRLEKRAPLPAQPRDPSPEHGASEAEDVRSSLVRPREPTLPTTEEPPRSLDPAGDVDGGGSALARDLDSIAESFLTPEPRVADLLGLCQEMASRAVVDPESLRIERDEEGAPRFANGVLEVGDLHGTFLIEEGTYHLRFSSEDAQLPWGGRDLQITFGEDSQATGCLVTVQFHPRTGEAASRHLAPDEERLVGWGVSVSPVTGALARPLTVRAEGDAWQIGEGVGWRELELPWISGTRSFDAWLRLLLSHSGR